MYPVYKNNIDKYCLVLNGRFLQSQFKPLQYVECFQLLINHYKVRYESSVQNISVVYRNISSYIILISATIAQI